MSWTCASMRPGASTTSRGCSPPAAIECFARDLEPAAAPAPPSPAGCARSPGSTSTPSKKSYSTTHPPRASVGRAWAARARAQKCPRRGRFPRRRRGRRRGWTGPSRSLCRAHARRHRRWRRHAATVHAGAPRHRQFGVPDPELPRSLVRINPRPDIRLITHPHHHPRTLAPAYTSHTPSDARSMG